MTHLDIAVLSLWLDGETTSVLLRHARRLGSSLATEEDIERLAESIAVDWRTVRQASRERRATEDLQRAATMTDDELIDAAMENHGNLPAAAMRRLEQAAAADTGLDERTRRQVARKGIDRTIPNAGIAPQDVYQAWRDGYATAADAIARIRKLAADENSGSVVGSGNFLADMGHPDPETLREKYLLANEITVAVAERGLTHSDVAVLTDLSPPDVARILDGIVKDYSVEVLRRVMTALGIPDPEPLDTND